MADEQKTRTDEAALATTPSFAISLGVALLLFAGLLGGLRLAFPDDGEETADRSAVASSEDRPGPASPPRRLELPTLGVEAPVLPIEMNTAGVLTPPADVDSVGWWQRSAKAGARRGQILVTGHTVRVGDGALDEIGTLESGDEVVLRAGGKPIRFRTTEVFTYTRDEVAENAVELFGQDGGRGDLVLVTCTDWNGEAWESNIIVRAERVQKA
ncbi:class F sortase [Nocardioides piscis]|uniref:Class F sortase n=1 Tax=Nocardioides piscis TaxID=2714938 RepID=A0A6G7YBL3_9ACTN|nr:class F sortase [Nocardioides piscis]QIK74294.1 class F sortase [Nocardioides piscis]